MEKLNFKLSEFEGPLDLLLFLISKHKLDILNIEITELLSQYLDFMHRSNNNDLDTKSEFLEMAARLINIKTLMLLPRHEAEGEELKRQLTEDLMEYSACKEAACMLGELKAENSVYVRAPMEIEGGYTYMICHDIMLLRDAITVSMGRKTRQAPPDAESFSGLVKKKIVSVESRIIYLLGIFYKRAQMPFNAVFFGATSKSELIATFLALLELIKDKRVRVSDDGENFSFLTLEPKATAAQ